MAEEVTDYTPPRAPNGLKDGGRRLWRTVCREWELGSGSEELELLRHAAQAQDMADRAEMALDEAGSLVFMDRFNRPTERPEVRIIRQSRAAVASLVKQIGQGQIEFRRLELATARHEGIEATRGARRDRRGGGVRHFG